MLKKFILLLTIISSLFFIGCGKVSSGNDSTLGNYQDRVQPIIGGIIINPDPDTNPNLSAVCTVNFSAWLESSGSADKNALSYLWDFGDGTTSTAVTPTHTYTHQGTFYVSLLLNGGKQESSSIIHDKPIIIAYGNQKPTVNLSADHVTTNNKALPINFTCAVDDDFTTSGFTYSWDFGDNSPLKNGTDLTTQTHIYNQEGLFLVTVKVTDQHNATTIEQMYIAIGQDIVIPPLANDFQYSIHYNSRNDPQWRLQFVATIRNDTDETLTYTWNFGDGTAPITGEHANVIDHFFTVPADYFISLTVENSNGSAPLILEKRLTLRPPHSDW